MFVLEVFNNPGKYVTEGSLKPRWNTILNNNWKFYCYNPGRVYLLRLAFEYSRRSR